MQLVALLKLIGSARLFAFLGLVLFVVAAETHSAGGLKLAAILLLLGGISHMTRITK